jgi:hypothetical protein
MDDYAKRLDKLAEGNMSPDAVIAALWSIARALLKERDEWIGSYQRLQDEKELTNA